jgi:hypothetical protein
MENKKYFEELEKEVKEVAEHLGCNANELWNEMQMLLVDSYSKGWKDAGGIVNGMFDV